MKRAKLIPGIILKSEKLSINQIAEQVINFYNRLALIDNNYSQLYVISEKKPINPEIDVNQTNSIESLAAEIINQNIDDIMKMDNTEHPDANFIFDKALISFALEVRKEGANLLTLSFCFSISKFVGSNIGIIIANEGLFDTLKKARFFLDTAKESFSVDYSVIKIFDRELNKIVRGLKAPLGWITYFSNNYEIPIPDDLEGIEYEHSENGKYLILTRENPITPEVIETNKKKLINLMGEIKERVPEYGK